MFKECDVLIKLYEDCFFDMHEKGEGLQTLWWPYAAPDPYTGEMMSAIPEHQIWNRKFNKHKKQCSKCQPERSKREDSQRCEMRCSEHCGNTVREAQ